MPRAEPSALGTPLLDQSTEAPPVKQEEENVEDRGSRDGARESAEEPEPDPEPEQYVPIHVQAAVAGAKSQEAGLEPEPEPELQPQGPQRKSNQNLELVFYAVPSDQYNRYAFLLNDYAPCYWYWDCVEMLRKAIVVGAISFYKPGSLQQL